VTWNFTRDANEVRVRAAQAHFTTTFDEEGRIATNASGAFPDETNERQRFTWRRGRLISIITENRLGVDGAETTLSYDCR